MYFGTIAVYKTIDVPLARFVLYARQWSKNIIISQSSVRRRVERLCREFLSHDGEDGVPSVSLP